jgi:N-acetyl-gamma-glutamyl-phosphate reductase
MAKQFRVGLIGARGYVGSELIRLIQNHPNIELAYVSSREREGQLLTDFEPYAPAGMHYVNVSPEQALELSADVVVLALPNNLAGNWVGVFDANHTKTLMIDLSADYRFDSSWFYGLPELTRDTYQGQRRISNPGCYATAMQLAIYPLKDYIASSVQCFGVSGYSGAGTTASDKNNLDKLQDNLMPYALVNHIHEREVARYMGCEIHFMPHVASHFRGLSITTNMQLKQSHEIEFIKQRYQQAYQNEAFIKVIDDAPWVTSVINTSNAIVGGLTLSQDGKRLVVVSVLDNLLKGAASQALQNINLGLALPEQQGIL